MSLRSMAASGLLGGSRARRIALVAILLATGCAHRSAERLVQQRELIGLLPSIPGERTHFAYAELVEEGEARRLSVRLLAPDGSRQAVVHALEEEAVLAARFTGGGGRLAEILPAYLGLGLPAPAPPALPHRLGPPLEGMELRLEAVDDPRYPHTEALRLYRRGDFVELHRVFVPPDAALRLAALTPDAAALSLRSETRAGRIVDLQAVDLLAGGRALLVEQARRAIDRGALEPAAALLVQAELLGAPEEGELWFEKARLRALRGAPAGRVTSALERALPFAPALYRMRARTEPAFERLAPEPSFVDVVAPRPLPGRDRAIRVPAAP